MNRSRNVITALLVTLVLGPAVGSSPAVAGNAGAGATRLQRSDFPSVAAVARHYRYYRGGSMDLFAASKAPVDIPSADCVGYDTSGVRVRSSRIANYLLPTGDLAYFRGLSDPTVAVYLFRTPRAAARSLAELRAAVRGCEGWHGDDDYAVAYRRVPMPKLGADRLAFRRTTDQSGLDRDYSAEAWIRTGRLVVDARVQRDPAAPRLRALFGLARAAVSAAGS